MYTPIQAAKVFSQIRKLLLSQPDFFKREGIFRVSGDHASSTKIINDILHFTNAKTSSITLSTEQFPIYDYISALKRILDDKESHLLDITNPEIKQLKLLIEGANVQQAAIHLNQFIHNLIISDDSNKHAVGEVLYTYMQLAKCALEFQNINKMGSKNLGIVLGPNFEKLLNDDPTKMLPLIHKLNDVASVMVEGDTYHVDFEQKYARHIIRHKNNAISKLNIEKSALKHINTFYQDRIEEHRERINIDKSQANTADRKNRKMLRAKIISDEQTIAAYQKVSQDEPLQRILEIKQLIQVLNTDIELLTKKYPDQLRSSLEKRFERLSIISHEIDELISDDEEAMDSPLRMSRNLLMLPFREDSSSESESVESFKQNNRTNVTRLE